MNNSAKFNLFLVLAFACLWTCKQLQPKEKKDEIVFGDIHISRKPCISGINELFGKGVDSSKACDCLLSVFYEMIKHDSLLLQKFQDSASFFPLPGPLNDSFNLAGAKCMRENILDSNYKFKFSPQNELKFKDKLKDRFSHQKGFDNIDVDALSECIASRLNGNITVGEYFSDVYFEAPRINNIIAECMGASK